MTRLLADRNRRGDGTDCESMGVSGWRGCAWFEEGRFNTRARERGGEGGREGEREGGMDGWREGGEREGAWVRGREGGRNRVTERQREPAREKDRYTERETDRERVSIRVTAHPKCKPVSDQQTCKVTLRASPGVVFKIGEPPQRRACFS